MARKTLTERLWARVEKTDTCWEWTGYRTPKGYGLLSATSPDGKGTSRQAHRIAFEEANGPIPEDRVVDHACLNPSCVRPEHLRLVTTKQNAEHRKGAQRNNRSSGVRGVYWHARAKKWRAMVRHDQRLTSVGLFDTVSQAEAAAIARRNELFTHNGLDRISH